MDIQLLDHEEWREESREDIEKRRGFSFWLGIEQKLTNLGADRDFIDFVCCAVPHHSTNQKIPINFEKIMIGCLMSSDHIK